MGGSEGASERAGLFCAARARLGAHPGGHRTHGSRTDSAGSHAATRLAVPAALLWARRPRRGPACVCVCVLEVITEGSRLGPGSSGTDQRAGRLRGSGRHWAGGGRPRQKPGFGSFDQILAPVCVSGSTSPGVCWL